MKLVQTEFHGSAQQDKRYHIHNGYLHVVKYLDDFWADRLSTHFRRVLSNTSVDSFDPDQQSISMIFRNEFLSHRHKYKRTTIF